MSEAVTSDKWRVEGKASTKHEASGVHGIVTMLGLSLVTNHSPLITVFLAPDTSNLTPVWEVSWKP